MNNLDNIEAMKKIDEDDLMQKTRDMPEQIERCWQDWQKIAIPSHYANTRTILILGMGGSAIGAALTVAFARTECPFVIETCRDYDIPSWVDKNTLVIGVSYSGDTEETLEAFRQAALKTEKLITISTGGKLASLGSQHKALHYFIDYKSQPRSAIGFMVTSILAILVKLRILDLRNEDILEVTQNLRELLRKIDSDVLIYRNPAKLLAQKVQGKIPIVLGCGIFSTVANRWKEHFNENAKNCAYFEEIPEMNHNSLVGLEFPQDLNKKIFFIILESKYSHPRNKLRQNIIKQIFDQRRLSYESVSLDPTGSRLAEMFQMILFGDYVAYYLSILNNVAPDPIKIINFLKEKLNENN